MGLKIIDSHRGAELLSRRSSSPEFSRESQTMQNKTTPADGRPRLFEKPVAWLFGPQLIGGLKGILLYTAYGDKLDPRDWMTANVCEQFAQHDGEEFWFDYLSDTGD